MKKPYILIAATALLLHSFCAGAKTVTQSTARLAGANHLIKKGVNVTSPDDLLLAFTATSQTNGTTFADYYVFNIRNTNGFVLVTADDKVAPVLAWSNEASFDYDKIAPSAKAWLGWYQRQIEYMITHDVTPTQAAEAAWKSLEKSAGGTLAAKTTSVAPLMTTKWNQSPYYNAQCPGVGTSKAVTGCVATAMAQVMKYWNWPKMGEGMHAYVENNYGNVSANFGTTTYQWSSMPNTLSSGNAAIATLMFHCGVSVNMDYSPAVSGAWPVNVYSNYINCSEYAFRTYFHYKPTVKGILRFGESYLMYPLAPYTAATWISTLKAELDAGRPFIYTGDDGSSGHAWVADGYQSSDNFFHFNWGWGGAGPDGYYSVDDIAPPVLGTGGGGGAYNFTQTATIGIEPDTYPSYTDNIKMKQPINFSTSIPTGYNKPISFTTKIVNARTTTFSGDIAAHIYYNNTHVATINTITGISLAAGDSSETLTFNTANLPRLVSNHYIVRLAYKNTGSSTWTPIGHNDPVKNYATLDIRNDTAIRLHDSIRVTTGLPMTPGGAVSLNTTLINQSETADFSGALKAQLVNVNTGLVYPIATVPLSNIEMWNTSYEIFSTPSLTAPAGLYALEILHQYNGTGSFYTISSKDFQNPKLVQVGAWSDVKPLNSIPDEIFAYPNPTRDYVNIIFNNHKVSELLVADITGRVLHRMPAPEGEATMQVPMAQYAPGTYLVQFVTDNGIISKKINIAE